VRLPFGKVADRHIWLIARVVIGKTLAIDKRATIAAGLHLEDIEGTDGDQGTPLLPGPRCQRPGGDRRIGPSGDGAENPGLCTPGSGQGSDCTLYGREAGDDPGLGGDGAGRDALLCLRSRLTLVLLGLVA
jgi:hypothetical protein